MNTRKTRKAKRAKLKKTQEKADLKMRQCKIWFKKYNEKQNNQTHKSKN